MRAERLREPPALCFRARWFETASPEERAEELNRRLARIPGEKKVRATRSLDDIPVIRAFLGPNYQPSDDLRIMDGLATLSPALLDEYRFTHVALTETTSTFTAVHSASHVVGDDDELHPGFCLRNSAVGAGTRHPRRLLPEDQVPQRNGRSRGDKRSLYRRHGANALYGERTPEAAQWARTQCDRVERGRAADVIETLRFTRSRRVKVK